MPLRISLIAVVLLAATASAAEVKTLKGDIVKGELVSIDAKAVVIAEGEEKKTIAINDIATLDFSAPVKVPANTAFHDIELTDGTILHCAEVQFKGTDFTAKLLNDGPTVTVPIKTVANVLWGANNPELRAKWDARIAARKATSKGTDDKDKNADGFGVMDKDPNDPNKIFVNMLAVTILSADDKGETFTFETGGKKLTRKMETIVGLYFHRGLDAAAPAVVCKVTDVAQNTIMVASVVSQEGGLQVKTPAGVTLNYKQPQLVRLDYSTANLTYLSDLTPSKVTEKTVTVIDHYRKDRNIDGTGPIRIGGTVYAKGLALHATTELEFRIKGDYQTLQGMAGVDHYIEGHHGPVVLRIYASTPDEANKLIFNETFNRADEQNSIKPIQLNVRNVQQLRIVVTRGQDNMNDNNVDPNLGLHLDLGDIRLVK